MKVLGVLTIVMACGGRSSTSTDAGAKQLASQIVEVSKVAEQLAMAIDEHQRAEQESFSRVGMSSGRRDYAAKFNAVMDHAVTLTKALTNQKRPVIEGKVKPCRDQWIATSDSLKDTLDPFVANLLAADSKQGSSEELVTARAHHWGALRGQWTALAPAVTAGLCDLKGAIATCEGSMDEDALVYAGSPSGLLGCGRRRR